MSTNTTQTGGALSTPTATGGCCGPATTATTAEPKQVSACCGTVAEAKAEGSCCGTAAKEQAVASGAGCCG